MNELQNPEITRAERNGIEYEYVGACDECNEPTQAGDTMFATPEGQTICEECMEERIKTDYTPCDIAWALGYRTVIA